MPPFCQQIDQPDLMIPIEWNSKTEKSQAKTQVDDLARPNILSCKQQYSFIPLMRSPVSLHPDAASFLGIMSEIPGTFGVPTQQQHDPCGHVHLSVLRARCGCCTSALSPVQRAALSAHDHQRATGTRGGRCVTLHTYCV